MYSCSFHSLLGPNVSRRLVFWPPFLGRRRLVCQPSAGKLEQPKRSSHSCQPTTANCQVPSAVPNCGNIFGDEARSYGTQKINAKNKRLKTRTGRDGWMNQQLASAPFGATSGGFSTWLAGHTFPLFQLPATRCRPSSWGITQRRSAQETPLGSTQ